MVPVVLYKNSTVVQKILRTMKLIFLIISIFASIQRYESANILAIFPFPGKSHFMMLHPIVKRLAEKGHDVDVMSHFPQKNPIPGYNDISIKGSMPILTNNVTVDALKPKGIISDLIFIFRFGGTMMCDKVLATEEAHMLKNTTKKYDVLIAHLMPSDCLNVFAGIFKIPLITISTTVNQPWSSDLIGIPDNPSYIPHNYSGSGTKMTLMERLWNTLALMMYKMSFDYFQEEANKIVQKHFGEGIPHLREIAKNTSLVITNSHFSIQQPRPAVPNFIEVAGVHIDGNIKLPEYFSNILNDSTNGVIYMSFGSMLMTETLPESTLKAMFSTFKKLPHRILWKANRELFPKHLEIPSNIQFESWLPQMGILCHPNTKLFISHGGMLSTQEANYCGVPILGIPIFADQSLNIKTVASKGTGLEMTFGEITEESFSKTVRKLLGNDFKRKAEQISNIYKDRPASPLDTAIYWIEYVIRHKGAYHLRSHSVELPWYQFYLIDVGCICVSVILLTLVFVYYTFKGLFRLFGNLGIQKVKTA